MKNNNKSCSICNKIMNPDDQIEYSEEHSEYYCSPDCAMTDYFNRARSRPLSKDEKIKYLERNKIH